ncbi:MAG: hypothetical protein M9894_18625 [Planctomycetes bacterium]|nr:hypothetical protein [Planctomycetota bacterium]
MGDDGAASAWLRSRGIAPASVEDLGLARALPPRLAEVPGWAGTRYGGWNESGHRFLLPLYGPNGALESLRARALNSNARPKSLAPRGYSVAGLVLACPLGRLMLHGSRLGDGTLAALFVATVGLVVVEGEPDYLSWATAAGTDVGLECAPAVLGLESGSWTDAVAARVPAGATVRVRTHQDEAGERYAARVIETLASRCRVLRLRGGDS